MLEVRATTYTDVGFAVDIVVTFEDMSLYNDQVYLSYHIKDENGGDILFENQRIPVNLDVAYMTLFVDCVNIEELAGRDSAIIEFDLVDQKNIYWFSRKTDIVFQAASVAFDRDLLQSPSTQTAGPSEESQDGMNDGATPDIFSIILNVLAWVAIAVLIVSITKTRPHRKTPEQSRAEQSRAEQSRAEQSRAEQSRAEQSRAERD